MPEWRVSYVDGFVIVVPKRNVPAYRRLAARAGKVWREFGALDYKECVGDDLKVKGARPFPRMLRLKRGETVVFSWILYRSKGQRDRVNAKIMKDPRIARMMKEPMLFDNSHMTYGGFRVLVDARK